LVILLQEPETYLIPSLGTSNIYIGLPFQKSLSSKWHIQQKDYAIKKALLAKKNIYVVVLALDDLKYIDWLNHYHLKVMVSSCKSTATLYNEYICQLIDEWCFERIR